MSQTELNEKILGEISAAAEAVDCEILDCQFKGGVLRLVIDRDGGVNLDDCQVVSKQVSALLDVLDFGSGRYLLEVSSPGLNRRLYRESDYEKYCGRKVRVTWKTPGMNTKRTVVGILSEYAPGPGEIYLLPEDGTDLCRIALRDIQLARLEPEF